MAGRKRTDSGGGGELLFLAVLLVVGVLGWSYISSASQSTATLGSGSLIANLGIPTSSWAFIAVGFVLVLLAAVAIGGGGHIGRRGLSVMGRK